MVFLLFVQGVNFLFEKMNSLFVLVATRAGLEGTSQTDFTGSGVNYYLSLFHLAAIII